MVWFLNWKVIFTKPFTETFRSFCSEAKTEYMDPIVTLCNFATNPRWTIVNVHLTVVFDIANSAKFSLIFSYFFWFFASIFTFVSWCCHPQFLARWSFIKKITATALNHSAVKWSVPVFFCQLSCCSKQRLCRTVTINRVFKKIVKESSAVTTFKSLIDLMIPFLLLYLAWLLPLHFVANLVPLGPFLVLRIPLHVHLLCFQRFMAAL